MSDTVRQNFVTFYSPGTFMSEETTKPINAWDAEAAIVLSEEILERHASKPFGFRFTTRERGPADLDSKVTARSGMFFLGGRVETIEEVERRNDPEERILRSNMRGNDWPLIVINDNSWRCVQPVRKGDRVLAAVGSPIALAALAALESSRVP